jgi:hypothetical protein
MSQACCMGGADIAAKFESPPSSRCLRKSRGAYIRPRKISVFDRVQGISPIADAGVPHALSNRCAYWRHSCVASLQLTPLLCPVPAQRVLKPIVDRPHRASTTSAIPSTAAAKADTSRSRGSSRANRRHGHRSKLRSYSITSSARASSMAGISRPIALAALRLITVANLVGACTGKSAGFSPFRMRST